MKEKYIELDAVDFFMYTAEMTNEETGILMNNICLAVLQDNLVFLSQYRFLGRIGYSGTNGRKSLPPSLRKEVLDRDGHACQYCGCQMWLEIDHIIPYSIVDQHRADNLQVLCKPCNGSKSNKYDSPVPK